MEIKSFEEEARVMRERAAQRSTPERQAHLTEMLRNLEATLVADALEVGDTAPDFALHEAGSAVAVTLSDTAQRGPVVLSFYRGQWCPYCNLEVRTLQSIHERVRALGGEIYLIGPETEESALKLREKTASTIPLLFDAEAAVCRAYRLAFDVPEYFRESYRAAGNDFSVANPGAGWTLPIPGTFVIGPDRKIVARHVDADYRTRMEPAEILAAVTRIVRG